MSFLRFKLGEPVVIKSGEMVMRQGTIKRRKPEHKIYLVIGDGIPGMWFHEAQLQTISEATREKYPLPP